MLQDQGQFGIHSEYIARLCVKEKWREGGEKKKKGMGEGGKGREGYGKGRCEEQEIWLWSKEQALMSGSELLRFFPFLRLRPCSHPPALAS